jgi:probable DNA repair protein
LPEKTRPAEWSRAFSCLLALLGWPGGRSLNSAEYQTVQAWMDLLSGFARLDAVAGEWTCPEALFELERLALETMFQPEGKDAPVQILGMLEMSGLHFDYLWIAGLHDEAWPAPARPAPFLPASLQRAQDLPHSSPARELKYAAQMTNKLLSSAASVVVSYPLNEGERKLGPSPLVRHLPASPVPEMEYDRTLVEEIRRSSRTETLAQDPAPPVSGGAWQRGGSRVFEFQSICPFRAFAELRLASKKIESPQDGLSARDRGILVHAAFEKAWMELGSQAELLRRSAEELAGLVSRVVASALQEIEEKREAILPRLWNLEQKRIEVLLAEWLEQEKDRPPFSVLTHEKAEYVDFAGIRCKVVLDRVDQLEADGRQVIIDYKTGKASPNSWTGSRPDQPQLPFYAVLREANLAAVLFAHIKTGESRFLGYADDGVNIPGAKTVDIREELAQWRTTLERLAAEFRAGEAAVDPKNTATACPSCPFPALCRIAELEAAAPSSGEDNDE